MPRIPTFVLLTIGMLSTVSCGGGPSRGAGERAAAQGPDTAAVALPTDTYHSHHDPAAFYTRDNIDFTGSYLKIDMASLTPDEFNRVIHRTMTEKSTCGSGLTIDECLVNRPWCWVAVENLKQIVREEKLKG
jgi:hypothetical protein